MRRPVTDGFKSQWSRLVIGSVHWDNGREVMVQGHMKVKPKQVNINGSLGILFTR